MEISTRELRIQPGRIIEKASRGQDVVITFRGKPLVKIVPVSDYGKNADDTERDKLFGLWKDHSGIEDVNDFVRKIRKGRGF